jgi:hypothetical protein
MAWSYTLNNHPDIIIDFEAHLLSMADDWVDPQHVLPSTSQPTIPETANPTTTQDKGKAAATSNIPLKLADPLKAMRQRQATEAKLNAAKSIKEAGARRKAEAIRQAEAAENQANRGRLGQIGIPRQKDNPITQVSQHPHLKYMQEGPLTLLAPEKTR